MGDEALMLEYCDGNAVAFEQLYHRHKGGIYRYLRRQCSNEAIVEDLFQDVWMNVVKGRKHYKPTAKFTTWLYHVAHNRLVDYYRQSGRMPASYDDDIAEVEDKCAIEPLTDIGRDRQAQQLLDCISQLPEAQRESFLLKEESGLSLAEIANVAGTGRETVKSRLRYALSALRRCLQGLL